MSGIYLHIPFCKQACTYCDFHFSTKLNKVDELVDAMVQELVLRKDFLKDKNLKSIYFGGGSPSVLRAEHLDLLLKSIDKHFGLHQSQEITLEANPDDFSEEKVKSWRALGINRLSIGIQSFRSEDLKLMNRAHNKDQAFEALNLAKTYFPNFTADLIYGIPGLSDEAWRENISTLMGFDPKHISAYALTVEPKTALEYQIRNKQIVPMSEEAMERQHRILLQSLKEQGFEAYEISNFAQPSFRAVHNSSYWHGEAYLGLGPSAHSYDGKTRTWNVANNSKYIKGIQKSKPDFQSEELSRADVFNEYIMTGLRLKEGIEIKKLASFLNPKEMEEFKTQLNKYLLQGQIEEYQGFYRLNESAYFLADGIASDLFLI